MKTTPKKKNTPPASAALVWPDMFGGQHMAEAARYMAAAEAAQKTKGERP